MQKSVVSYNQACVLKTIPTLSAFQDSVLNKLLAFATYQIQHDLEVKHMPSKFIYKVNQELKLSLVALLTTCALLDPTRHSQETEEFFNRQVNIIQKNQDKLIHFGQIRPFLIQNFLIPEIVDDWITYRDVCGDGIYALKDKKTLLQGLDSFAPGGTPVMEFARFYRKFMENKLKKQNNIRQQVQQTALKSLTDEIVRRSLENGASASDILDRIMNDNLLSNRINQDADSNLFLPKK